MTLPLISILLDWPKSSFGFVCNIVWKPERTFWPIQYMKHNAVTMTWRHLDSSTEEQKCTALGLENLRLFSPPVGPILQTGGVGRSENISPRCAISQHPTSRLLKYHNHRVTSLVNEFVMKFLTIPQYSFSS